MCFLADALTSFGKHTDTFFIPIGKYIAILTQFSYIKELICFLKLILVINLLKF